MSARQDFETDVRAGRERLIELCRALVRIGSENPPGDTAEIAGFIEALFQSVASASTRLVTARAPAVNLLTRIGGHADGRRLVFNGHLDTFPVGDAARWTVPPLGGDIADGRIYGRGAADMKAGVAAAVMAALLLAEWRAHWRGEVVLALVADEETGGRWGTQHLLAEVPEAKGDAMLSGDAGAPRVLRIGEKGQLWIEIVAAGRANHGAHVHLGVNAIERLIVALDAIRLLTRLECALPDGIRQVIERAKSVSEAVSGAGEAETLRRVTVNIGRVEGGIAVNIIPDRASALVDVRFPPGLTVAEVQRQVATLMRGIPGVAYRILSSCEATFTDPAEEIVRLATQHAAAVTGAQAVVNMRVGFSDARFYRLAAVPSVVYGPTPHNMGGADEYVTIEDLFAVFYVHAMTAFDYLR